MASGKNITDGETKNKGAIDQQNNLDSYNERQARQAEDTDKLDRLKEQCPIKNSDLVNYDTSKERCTLKECPNGFVKSADGTKCEMYIDDIDIYRYKKDNSCGEQYIDWITIPNYHLGNSFFKLNTGESKDDFNGCFEPCDVNFVPYKTKDDKNASKSKDSIHCIRKSIIDIGRYGKYTLDYCPLVLILLLSCDILENNEFRGEYVREKTNKKIEPSIINEIKDNELLLSEMKDELKAKGKKYIIHLLQKYKPDFLEKIKLVSFELDKCYDTSILNLSSDNREPILHAYKVYKDSIDEANDLEKYVNAYKYMSNDGDVVQLMELHKKVLKWACDVAFDKNTDYGKRNLFLYEKFSNPEETDSSIDKELEYIRKVNKNEIKNENDIFYNFDFLHPGKVLLKLMYSGDNDDIMKNSYILGLPATIILLSVFVILVIVAVLFYKYTKPIYARIKEVFVLVVYNIASIFDINISPKYIIKDLLNNLREQITKQDENSKNLDKFEKVNDTKKVDLVNYDDNAKELLKDKPEELLKDKPEELLKDKPEELLKGKPEDVLKSKAEELLKGKAEELLKGKPEDVLKSKAEELLKGKAEELLKGKPEDFLKGKAEELLKGKPEDVLKSKAEELLKGKAEELLKGKPEDFLKGKAEELLKGKPEDFLKGKAEELLKGKPEDFLKSKAEELLKGKGKELLKDKGEELLKGKPEDYLKSKAEKLLKGKGEELLKGKPEDYLKSKAEKLLKGKR
jgi:hypothetical protein